MRGSKPRPRVVGRQLTADEYLEHWEARRVWHHLAKPHHVRRLNMCADLCRGGTFSDVGCMYGHSTAAMAKRRPGRWTGIDFTAPAVDKARLIFPTLDFLYVPEVRDLAAAGTYDSVVCSEVIEHVADDAALLRQLVLSARERVVVTTPNRDAQDPGHVRIYTRETLEALLAGTAHTVEMDDFFFYAVVEVPR